MTNEKEDRPAVAFHQHGEEFYLARKGSGIVHMELPPGTYEVAYHMEKGFYLDRVKDMKLPKRVYGDVETFANRVMRRFDVGNENMGTLLIGRKGSGKTLTLKKLAELSIRMTMPVILVQQAFSGMGLGKYLSMFEQPMMVAMDEFDKMYAPTKDDQPTNPHNPTTPPGHPATQNEIISLLQGTVGGGKKLFVLSANSAANVSEYLKNRPGRIRYTKFHGAMDVATIMDYAREHLADKSDLNIASLLAVSRQATEFNFDLMQAIVEDMNLYKEDAYQTAELIVSGSAYAHDTYIVEVRKAGVLIAESTSSVDMAGAPTFYSQINHTVALDSDEMTMLELRHENFKGFGESLLDLIYEKDDVEVRLLYAAPPYAPIEGRSFLVKPKSPRAARVEELYERQRQRNRVKHEEEQARLKEQEKAEPTAWDKGPGSSPVGLVGNASGLGRGPFASVKDPSAADGIVTRVPLNRRKVQNANFSGAFAPRSYASR